MFEERSQQLRLSSEKEDKDKKFIIYRAKEEEGLDLETRKQNDDDIVKKILRTIEREEIQVKAVHRMGRFNGEKHAEGKRRPLKVVLLNKSDKDSVLRNSFKLKDSDLKEMHLGLDMTREERKLVTDKIDEANNLNNTQAEITYRVRGPPWSMWLKPFRKTTPANNTEPPPANITEPPPVSTESQGD